jgi:hypothetical protein
MSSNPREIRLATGQVVLQLWLRPDGLTKKALLELSDEDLPLCKGRLKAATNQKSKN